MKARLWARARILTSLLCAMAAAGAADAAPSGLLHARSVHLRNGDPPEWESFATSRVDGARLDLPFSASANAADATLFIRQEDVRQDWTVELNGRRLGHLFAMEACLVHRLAVPAGALREGSNHLAIVPPREVDDIVVSEIMLDPRPMEAATAEATLRVRVRDATAGKGLPCRITLVDSSGALAAVVAVTNTALAPKGAAPGPVAVRPGVVYTGSGFADLGVRAGTYTVRASRGFEWSAAGHTVTVQAGDIRSLDLGLRRDVDTEGWVACDTHVHTFTHSGHGDATVAERMLTIAGEGIELPVATDHNCYVDYAEPARLAGVAGRFTPIVGNEVTTPAGHFNIFPANAGAPVPDFTVTDWPRLMIALRATPGVRVIVLNHPRNVHNGFQPFAATNFNAVTGENLRGPEFSFDAMEVLNSSAQQSDYLLVYRDWFALLNHGYRVTAVGSSDSHDVSRYIVGQGRTYVRMPDRAPGRLDIATVCSNLLAGRAVVSMGLLPQLEVAGRFGPGDLATNLAPDIAVTVRVFGPTWAGVTNVTLFANGVAIREKTFAANSRPGLKATIRWTLPRPLRDANLVAIATGPEVTELFWAIPKPYQPASPRWAGRVIGSTNPIWLDADGDGRFTAARDYARAIVRARGNDATGLMRGLAGGDEAIAAQAASLCRAAGVAIDGEEFRTALRSAAPAVQRGFAAFQESERLSGTRP